VGHPKKLNVLKDGDHRMSNPLHQETFIREASLWFKTGLLGF
jgi:dipeptidyl aminopeptidase/acylaminoacyl peptidase